MCSNYKINIILLTKMDEIPIDNLEIDIENYGENEIPNIFYTMSEKVKLLKTMSNENKLYLYKYYKQSTQGNINIPEPNGWFNFEAKEKYKAWKSVEDTSKVISMKKYIKKVKELCDFEKI